VLVTGRAEVDDLYPAASLLLEEDVLWLEIAVDDPVAVQDFQALEDGVCKLADQSQAEPLELVLLDQFVQVHGQKFEGDADVVAEGKRLDHVDDVVYVVLVLLAQVLQYPDLFLSLAMESLLVAHHLQGDVGVGFVIVGFHDLPEAALADDLQHFVAVGDVIVRHVDVLSGVVVVAAVLGAADDALTLLRAGSQEVDLGVVEDLVVLVGGQLVHVVLHGLFGAHVGEFSALVAGRSGA